MREGEPSPEPNGPSTGPTAEELRLFARAVNFATNVRMTEWPDGFSSSTAPDQETIRAFQDTAAGAQ